MRWNHARVRQLDNAIPWAGGIDIRKRKLQQRKRTGIVENSHLRQGKTRSAGLFSSYEIRDNQSAIVNQYTFGPGAACETRDKLREDKKFQDATSGIYKTRTLYPQFLSQSTEWQ